jgi:hypothetical protein
MEAQNNSRLILELSVKTIYVRQETIGRKNATMADKTTNDEREGKALDKHFPIKRQDNARRVNEAK